MRLTEDELGGCAEECMKCAAQTPDPANVEEDARAALQRLVDDRNPRIRGSHREAIRALRRALVVDLQQPANRKGELPRALGLVSRVSKATAVRDRAIVLMMHRLLEHSESHPDPAMPEPVFPYSTVGLAADAVVEGFHHARIDTHLTPVNVEQIWARRPQARRDDTSVTDRS